MRSTNYYCSVYSAVLFSFLAAEVSVTLNVIEGLQMTADMFQNTVHTLN